MKTIITSIVSISLLLTTFFATAQTTPELKTEGTTITVTVPVKSNSGDVYFALHNANTFMKQGIDELNAPVADGKAIVTFKNVAPGDYAVLLFHDANGNKQMDFETNGMPKEMYGVSNNVMNFGPPQWSDAKFEVGTEPVSLEIVM